MEQPQEESSASIEETSLDKDSITPEVDEGECEPGGSTTDAQDGGETEGAKLVSTGSQDSDETERVKLVSNVSQDSDETEGVKVVSTGSQDADEEETEILVPTGSQDADETEKGKLVSTGSQDAEETEKVKLVSTGSQDADEEETEILVPTGSQDADETEKVKLVSTGSQDAEETEKEKLVSTGSQDADEEETEILVSTGSQDAAETETEKLVSTVSKDADATEGVKLVSTDSQDADETETEILVSTGSQDADATERVKLVSHEDEQADRDADVIVQEQETKEGEDSQMEVEDHSLKLDQNDGAQINEPTLNQSENKDTSDEGERGQESSSNQTISSRINLDAEALTKQTEDVPESSDCQLDESNIDSGECREDITEGDKEIENDGTVEESCEMDTMNAEIEHSEDIAPDKDTDEGWCDEDGIIEESTSETTGHDDNVKPASDKQQNMLEQATEESEQPVTLQERQEEKDNTATTEVKEKEDEEKNNEEELPSVKEGDGIETQPPQTIVEGTEQDTELGDGEHCSSVDLEGKEKRPGNEQEEVADEGPLPSEEEAMEVEDAQTDTRDSQLDQEGCPKDTVTERGDAVMGVSEPGAQGTTGSIEDSELGLKDKSSIEGSEVTGELAPEEPMDTNEDSDAPSTEARVSVKEKEAPMQIGSESNSSFHLSDDQPDVEPPVQRSETEAAMSVKVKKEILDDVLGDSQQASQAAQGEKDKDVKPCMDELDKAMDGSAKNDSPVDGKAGDGRKNKGSSIKSIVANLFTKKEEEARKMKETEEKPPKEEIANVPFKISGVKSLAPNNRQQQRAEKRSSSPPMMISNVTSLATGVEKCSKCSKQLVSLDATHKWQKERFCSFSCLDTTRLTSTKTISCDSCSVVLHPRVRHVYWAKVGKEYREFCSASCAKNSEQSPKVCPGCGSALAASGTAILAQAGAEGIFFEFCKQDCVDKYEERIINDVNKDTEPTFAKKMLRDTCAECKTIGLMRYNFLFHQDKKLFCSEACFDSFRIRHNTKISRCSSCHCMCYNDTSAQMQLTTEGKTYYFCTKKCQKLISQPCCSCNSLRLTRTMIKGEGLQPGLFIYYCSVMCRDKQLHKNKTSSISQAVSAASHLQSLAGLPQSMSAATKQPVGLGAGTPQAISSSATHQLASGASQPTGTQTTGTQSSGTQSAAGPQAVKCDHCVRVQRPLYHLTMSDHTLRNFCSYNCVISFQSQFSVPPVTLPHETLLLRCHKCQRGFSSSPFVLDYEDKTSLFCSEPCLDDFKRTKCVTVDCDQCHMEKILYEKTFFCGELKAFCSQGCMLLYKQEIVETLGLQCVVCDYCAQLCQGRTEKTYDGKRHLFCNEECSSKYDMWYSKTAKCDGCKVTGRQLSESFPWRGEIKHVCNQQCLLLFYTQQNIPNVTTQLPEPIPTSTAEHATPTIAKVMSLAPVEKLGAVRQYIEETKKTYSNKQTQITTNTVYIKPPPPPPSDLPPAPKMVKNKITSCKPIQITKATMCRPIMKDMNVGTDFPRVPAILPIPVPIYVPVPMQMFSMPIPYPVIIPLPVPTPMFLPVAARDCDRLLKTLEEIKNRIPSDPLEAELFMMAAAAAGDEEAVEEAGSEKDEFGRILGLSDKDSSVGGDQQRTHPSLVDQAMVECGLMDEPMDDVGVDELLASLSSPDMADDMLLLDDIDLDPKEAERKKLMEELAQGLGRLGDIPESAGDPPPPPTPKKVKRITLKKKRRKRKVVRKKRGATPSAASAAPAPSPAGPETGLRRSSRAAKRTKQYNEDEVSQDSVEEEEEYEPPESSSEEEIVEMVDDEEPPEVPPVSKAVQRPATDTAWVKAGLLAFKLFTISHNETASAALQLPSDPLDCSPDMLHRGLILFVRNARQPSGQPYTPDTLLLLFLSVQRYMTENGRLENFLIGPNFEQLRAALHEALSIWTPRLHPVSELLLNTRIDEEMMWSAQQLGAHSPHVLLSTIFFFNSKNLRMRSVEEHSRLAFFRMQKLVKKCTGTKDKVSLLRYFPPKKKVTVPVPDADAKKQVTAVGAKRKKEFDPEIMDQSENTVNPLRCPVKLYEFYLSKCPESVKMRNEIFYLLPEYSCVPDSPVWYSATKLPDQDMERMLRRYGMVYDVQAAWRVQEKQDIEEREQQMKEEEEQARRKAEEQEKQQQEQEQEQTQEQAPDDEQSKEQAGEEQAKEQSQDVPQTSHQGAPQETT